MRASVVGLLFVFHEDQGAFLILADVGLLLLAGDAPVGLFLHMVEDLLVELLKASSEFFILFPDLYLVEFGVVGQLGHVLVALRIGEAGVVDGGQGIPGGSSHAHHSLKLLLLLRNV